MKTENVMVRVDAFHVEQGIQSDYYRCPVALAISEVVKEEFDVHVMDTSLTISKPVQGFTQLIGLPAEVTRWIRGFDSTDDDDDPPSGISFEIPIRADFLREAL